MRNLSPGQHVFWIGVLVLIWIPIITTLGSAGRGGARFTTDAVTPNLPSEEFEQFQRERKRLAEQQTPQPPRTGCFDLIDRPIPCEGQTP